MILIEKIGLTKSFKSYGGELRSDERIIDITKNDDTKIYISILPGILGSGYYYLMKEQNDTLFDFTFYDEFDFIGYPDMTKEDLQECTQKILDYVKEYSNVFAATTIRKFHDDRETSFIKIK